MVKISYRLLKVTNEYATHFSFNSVVNDILGWITCVQQQHLTHLARTHRPLAGPWCDWEAGHAAAAGSSTSRRPRAAAVELSGCSWCHQVPGQWSAGPSSQRTGRTTGCALSGTTPPQAPAPFAASEWPLLQASCPQSGGHKAAWLSPQHKCVPTLYQLQEHLQKEKAQVKLNHCCWVSGCIWDSDMTLNRRTHLLTTLS